MRTVRLPSRLEPTLRSAGRPVPETLVLWRAATSGVMRKEKTSAAPPVTLMYARRTSNSLLRPTDLSLSVMRGAAW
jgi:hypothetical protein